MTELPGTDGRRSAPVGPSAGAAVILSANPIHDTGGGQRSAQLALELLDRGFSVLFVSHGKVTETVDLGIRYDAPRLTSIALSELGRPAGRALLEDHLSSDEALVLTQVPVRDWEPVLRQAREAGAVTVYDCIDLWDSELGRGWYREGAERRIARGSDVLVASANELVHHVEQMTEREVALVPNAYNSRVFRPGIEVDRPGDLPSDGRLGLYVGALWGGWLDWDLVGRAAWAEPDTTFVFVGDHRREGRGLPGNCVFLGLKRQTDLPGYLAHCDFAFLPWRADEVTQATSPLKVYEFVAMGLPVLGPDIETLKGIPGVSRFRSGEEFIAEAGSLTREGLSEEERRAMAGFAASNSWVQRVDTLLEATSRSVGSPLDDRVAGPAVHARRAIVSVVIPSYNHERWVGEAVRSVAEQTLPAGELVVVDDGSTDRSATVVSESGFPRLRLVRQENRGAHAAINRGITLSRGEFVTILNSDDELTPERLEHSWGVARTTGAALVVGGVSLIDSAGRPLPEDHDSARWYREARSEPARAGSLRQALLKHNFAVTTSNFFFHKELWRRLGGFGPYRYAHDLDFILRALELCGDRVVYADELEGVRYRVHGSNTILEDVDRALGERSRLVRRIRSPLRRIRSRVGRARARSALERALADVSDLVPLAGPAPTSTESSRSVGWGRRLRVGLVAPSLDQGGLEEVVALLAQALPHEGVEPHVLCTESGGSVAERLASAGVPVTVGRGRADEWRRWTDETEPDVLSTHFVSVDAIQALAEHGSPIFETVHNTYAWFGEDDWARETDKLSHLAGTVAVSDVVAEYHALFTRSEVTTRVVPNGVHPARAASVPRDWARKRLGLPAGVPVLVHLGRVTLQKNLVGLLDAFEGVLEQEPSARLVLAGSFADAAYVRRLRKAHARLLDGDSVLALPPVPHAGALLSAADVYVSDSFFEGWSLAASEAVWNGLPLVLSECGSARQLVGESGERGRVVPNPLDDPLDVTWQRLEALPARPEWTNQDSLVAAILDVLAARDEWEAKRAEIVGYARTRLHPSRVATAYAEVFRSAVTP